MDDPIPARIAAKIDFGFCWVWTGARMTGDYGKVHWQGSLIGVHRVMWELLVGPIPAGLDIDHMCRNHPCCNPEHLVPATTKVNRGWKGDRTRCPHGHLFDETNTYWWRGHRLCRTCRRIQQRAFKARRRHLRSAQPSVIDSTV